MNALKNLMAALTGSIEEKAASPGSTSDDPAVSALLAEFHTKRDHRSIWQWTLSDIASLAAMAPFLSDDRGQVASLVLPLVQRLSRRDSSKHDHDERYILGMTLDRVLQKRLPLGLEHFTALLKGMVVRDNGSYLFTYPRVQTIRSLEEYKETGRDMTNLVPLLETFVAGVGEHQRKDRDMRQLLRRIDLLSGKSMELPIQPGEAWADAALMDLRALEEANQAVWGELLRHCQKANSGKPAGKWLKDASRLLGLLPAEQFETLISRWLLLVDKKRHTSALTPRQWQERCVQTLLFDRYSLLYDAGPPGGRRDFVPTLLKMMQKAPDAWAWLQTWQENPEIVAFFDKDVPDLAPPAQPPEHNPVEDLMIIEPHVDLLCGLAWTCSLTNKLSITRGLGSMALSSFKKVPGRGPRAIRLGHACIWALGQIGGEAALGQLALLKVKVKFGGAQASILKALTLLAEKLGVSREDLEEMSVPGYGMNEPGLLQAEFGDYTAELRVISSHQTELVWRKADGKIQKAPPASLKQTHAEDLKELTATRKDIEKMLPAQSERLDNLYLQRKTWPLALWRERYFDHPLVGALARRLIWNFTTDGVTTPGIWINDNLADRAGQPLVLNHETTQVTLWHPLQQPVEVVLGWRAFLEEWEITQPFKQAHREVYVLTPAEEQTQVYSNRFAAHLLRQHQFNSLCAARGWKNKLRLMVDDEYPPATRLLPAWGLRAEFWIEGAGDDVLDSGAYRYVSTDQVRFYLGNDGRVTAHAGGGGYHSGWRQMDVQPRRLDQIEPIVLSEVMRDVDLFVGVASVGNDPNWLDGGANGQQRDYWQGYSFGELNASAQTRRTVLERLVPRLKIASQCVLNERFLEVQGKRHRYKIHLGSGNILIAEGDKYLCIVPSQAQTDKAGDKLFLPFEGDRTLSVILSKAFLLAADDKITDATILRQL